MRVNSFDKIFNNIRFKKALDFPPPIFPFWVQIEVTNHCNLRCIFCTQLSMRRKKGYMTMDLYKKLIDEMKIYNSYPQLCGTGEPFLHPKINDFIKYTKKQDVPLMITTNGLLLNDKHMHNIIDSEVDWIMFSMQGTTKERYCVLRNTDKYDVLCSNIKKLVELRGDKDKPFITLSTTITSDETNDMVQNFYNQWTPIVERIQVGNTNLSWCNLDAVNYTNSEVMKLLDFKKYESINRTLRVCADIYQKPLVNWDGKVSACCNDYDDFLTIGDLNEDSLYNIWNKSERLNFIRWAIKNNYHNMFGMCRTCYSCYTYFPHNEEKMNINYKFKKEIK